MSYLKQTLILIGLFFCFSTNMEAQKQLDKTAKKVAKELCKCINNNLSGMDEDVLDALTTMLSKSSEASQEQYYNGLSEDLRNRMNVQINQLDSFGEDLDQCLDNTGMEDQVANLASKYDVDSELFLDKVVEMLEKNKKCKTAYLLMDLGSE